MSKARKNQVARLDKLWSKLVVEKDQGICQKCGRFTENPHHVFLKSKYGTRWVLENGINLCAEECHVPFAHAKPEAFMAWWRHFVGEETYLIVLASSMDIKIDLDEAEETLKNI